MKTYILRLYYRWLGWCAHRYIRRHNPFVVGVSGSVGKTSCRLIISHVLRATIDPYHRIYTSPKNFNGELGMPLSIMMIENREPKFGYFVRYFFLALYFAYRAPKQYDTIILEYGIDRPGEMRELVDMVSPDFAVITKLDSVHAGHFDNVQGLISEELIMIESATDMIFINTAEEYAMMRRGDLPGDVFLYNTTLVMAGADIRRSEYIVSGEQGLTSEATITIRTRATSVRSNLIGEENYGYIGVGFAIAETIAYRACLPFAWSDQYDFTIPLLPGRKSIFAGVAGSLILDSSYNASPQSMKKILTDAFMIRDQLYPDYKIIAILGDMRELGEASEEEHRDLATAIVGRVDRVALVGREMRQYLLPELEHHKTSLGKYVHHYSDSVQAGKAVRQFIHEDHHHWLIIVKGSQNTIFLEEAVKILLAHPEDSLLLCRQEDKRLQIKGITSL